MTNTSLLQKSVIYGQLSLITLAPGWKVLQGTNTPAYYEHLQITDAKSFLTLDKDGARLNIKSCPIIIPDRTFLIVVPWS